MKEQLKIYIQKNLVKEKTSLFKKLKTAFTFAEECCVEQEYESSIPRDCSLNINDYITENQDKYSDFQTLLFKHIDNKNLTDPEVYNKVHFDRRQFSKIRCDSNYHPSKETVLLLAFALELSEQELEELLESASYSLPKNNHYDLIIRFCFINKIYKLTEVNNLLDEYDCKLFNY